LVRVENRGLLCLVVLVRVLVPVAPEILVLLLEALEKRVEGGWSRLGRSGRRRLSIFRF